ncbi:TonB-dependent receptor [Chryseobacterium sp.]|uniref:TonB-dependent receptor n=1 Tax=Chryseobacterium sp. TaxID=1871047 RepID=UPI0025BA5446|nr:TonB-dependent receptor [Chryseobacterium sp.]MBV8325167.1 TonB-dependent receptor [Chryseobacterium sp.]
MRNIYYSAILLLSTSAYYFAQKKQDTISIDEKRNQIQEVIISTQKRAQSKIEVPVTVSALSGRFLDQLNLKQMDEMANFVPGLEVQLQSPNNPGYVIRGVTSDSGDSRAQPRVSIFQDGVSISRSRASVVELYDLESIEVAKGPQGTLFGRGAQIGALHIIQNKPKNKFGAEINTGYGTYNHSFINGYINTPIVKDKLANRLALDYERRDGFISNRSGGRLNGKEVIALRNSTKLWLSPQTNMTLILNYQHDDYPGTGFKSKRFAPLDGDTDSNTFADLEQGKNLYIKRDVGGATLLLDHTLNDQWKFSSISGFRAFKSDESFDADGTAAPIFWASEIAKGTQASQEFRFSFNYKNKFSGFLGTSYFYENSTQAMPMRIDERAFYPAYVGPLLKDAFIQQMAGLGKQLGLPAAQILGLQTQIGQILATPPVMTNGQVNYVTHLPNLQPFALQLINMLTGGKIPPGMTWDQLVQSGMLPSTVPKRFVQLISVMNGSPLQAMHTESFTNKGINKAFEIFGDATYSLTDRLKFTLGLRGSYENQKGGYMAPAANPPSVIGMIANNGSPNIVNPVSNEMIYASKDYYSYVGRIALNYLFEKNNIYASFSRGRRPGVINILPSTTEFLRPEIVYSYEIGMKGLLFAKKLSYELSSYFYDWSHFQTMAYREMPGSIAPMLMTNDGGKAHTFGVETALKYLIIPGLQIFGNYSYIDGKFDQNDENGNRQEYAGHRFRLTPKHSYALGIDASIKTGATSSVYLRPSYSYRSGVFFEDSNREDLYQKGYGLMNFTAGFTFKSGSTVYDIGAYGKNILDTQYMIDGGNSGDIIGFPTFIGGTRSVVGGQIKVTF